jgi:predicted aldo/keto reductase-like oxidoreductase
LPNSRALEAAVRHDMGVFIISTNDKGGKLYEAPEKLESLCSPLSPMAFNNLFCLRNPGSRVLRGVSRHRGRLSCWKHPNG